MLACFFHLEDARPDRKACDEQEPDNDERREQVAQPLRAHEDPREVAGRIEHVVPAHLSRHSRRRTRLVIALVVAAILLTYERSDPC